MLCKTTPARNICYVRPLIHELPQTWVRGGIGPLENAKKCLMLYPNKCHTDVCGKPPFIHSFISGTKANKNYTNAMLNRT